MGNCWVKISCSTQLFLLDHYNCLTAILLHILYAIDVMAYTITGPLKFLTRRSAIYGQNYASLGRIIVGQYSKCTELIESPQKRGHYLGRAKLMPSRVATNFPLFLSDEDAGGGTLHSKIHEYIYGTLVPPAFARLSSPEDKAAFDGYIASAVEEIQKLPLPRDPKGKQRTILRTMTIKYVFHSLFGTALDDKQVEKFYQLFFGMTMGKDYVAGALSPYAGPFGCCMGKRNSNISYFTSFINDTPALKNFVKSEETGNLSKENYASILLGIVGIAGCVGTSQLCSQVVNAIPADYPINLNDSMEVTRAVLEAARIKAPVNNVNIILQNPLTLIIRGREYTFSPGTPVAASIGLSSVDANEFQHPSTFNPERENLLKSSINFNHVGYSAVGSGKRQCPGRNIAVKLASDLLIAIRSTENFYDDA